MKFNQIILEKLTFIFDKYNLRIVEQRNDYLKVQSVNLEIVFVHNQLENSNNFFLSERNKKSNRIEINNKVLKLFFNSDIKLSQVPVDIFVSNLVLFFENEGKSLLAGDLSSINALEKFDLESSHLYTQNLLRKQILESANKAWDKGNYREFVNLIDQINKDDLSSSYQLKYKVANQRLEE